MSSDASRAVVEVLRTYPQREGDGFVVRRPIPSRARSMLDPFLWFDEVGPVSWPRERLVAANEHPHRGVSVVTYVLEGELAYEDSLANRGSILPGSLQWMTAGTGIVHAEAPSPRLLAEGGRLHAFQLWVNLRASDKRGEPFYRAVAAAQVPMAQTVDGLARVRVLVGEALGVTAPLETQTPVAIHDWTLEPAARVRIPLREEFQGFVYAFRGEVRVGRDARTLREGQLAVLTAGDGSCVELSRSFEAQGAARVLLVAGTPLREPVARWGSFVMNTEAEVFRALEEYGRGLMGRVLREGRG